MHLSKRLIANEFVIKRGDVELGIRLTVVTPCRFNAFPIADERERTEEGRSAISSRRSMMYWVPGDRLLIDFRYTGFYSVHRSSRSVVQIKTGVRLFERQCNQKIAISTAAFNRYVLIIIILL